MIETTYAGAIDVPEDVVMTRRGGQVFSQRSLSGVLGQSALAVDEAPRRDLDTDCIWLVPTWQPPTPEPEE